MRRRRTRRNHDSGMNRLDRMVRYRIYQGFVHHGTAPSLASIAASEQTSTREVRTSLERLADAHELVLGPGDPGVWMAHPFSGVATDYRVTIGPRQWFANCAWDGLAILALIGDGSVDTTNPLTGQPWTYHVHDGETHPDGVVYFPTPARHFWDDIGYT